MPQEYKGKKIIRLKIALISIFTILLPYLLGLVIHLTPIFYFIIAAVSAILAVLCLLWILKPLSILVNGTKGFADGNLNHRIDIRSNDEFEDVGNSFNSLAEKLSKLIQKLESDREIAISERNKFNEIFSSVIDGIIALDFNKNVIFLNKAAEELTGYNQAEVHGKPIDQIIHVFAGTEEVQSKTYCQESFNQTTKLMGKDNKQTKVNLTAAQVGGTVQTNLNCVLILHDLSREEELEQMKLDFVSMASHELKTPLTSVMGYLSVFLDESRDKLPKENLLLLDKAFVATKQLQTLIQNLLNVNKIERDQLSVSPEPVDYPTILNKAVEDLRSQANQKDIIINIVPPPQALPKVFADPIRLGEVITNLLSNAINYTNSGGRVEIVITVSPTEMQTTISDNGIGIPKDAMPHLFGKFFRVSNTEQKANKGTGLGLYITKSIVEKLHGKIWVESEVGKGTKFSFTLPIVTLNTGASNNNFVSQAIQSGTLNY